MLTLKLFWNSLGSCFNTCLVASLLFQAESGNFMFLLCFLLSVLHFFAFTAVFYDHFHQTVFKNRTDTFSKLLTCISFACFVYCFVYFFFNFWLSKDFLLFNGFSTLFIEIAFKLSRKPESEFPILYLLVEGMWYNSCSLSVRNINTGLGLESAWAETFFILYGVCIQTGILVLQGIFGPKLNQIYKEKTKQIGIQIETCISLELVKKGNIDYSPVKQREWFPLFESIDLKFKEFWSQKPLLNCWEMVENRRIKRIELVRCHSIDTEILRKANSQAESTENTSLIS